MTPLFLAALLYLWTAVNYANDSRWGMVIAFITYAIANLGFALDMWLEK